MRMYEPIEINGNLYPHYRDATPEEEAEAVKREAEEEARKRQQLPTTEDRLAVAEALLLEMLGVSE